MQTRERIIQGFKELVREKPVHLINVMDICKKAYVSRKCFYNYFKSQDDLIENILLEDVITPIRESYIRFPTDQYKSMPKLVTEKYYQTIFENREYLEKFVTEQECPKFQNLLIREMTKINLRALANSEIPDNERDYMAYFYSSSQSMLSIKWIQDGFIFTPHEMMTLYFRWTLHAWWRSAKRDVEWKDVNKY